MDHKAWYDRITDNAPGRSAAMKAGISVATLNRQLARGVISAENVIAIARAYNQAPVSALLATGYLRSGEVSPVTDLKALLDSVGDRELIHTLALRINANAEAWFAPEDLLQVDSEGNVAGPVKLHAVVPDDEEIRAAEDESLKGKAAAQKRTPPLEEEHP